MKDVRKKVVKIIKVMVVAVWSLGLVCNAAQKKKQKPFKRFPLYLYLAPGLDQVYEQKIFSEPFVIGLRMSNFWRALDYVEGEVLVSTLKLRFFNKILEIIKQINKIVTSGETREGILLNSHGLYRKKNEIIFKESIKTSIGIYLLGCLLNGTINRQEIGIILDFLWRRKENNNALPTQQEHKALKKVAYLQPRHQSVKNLMKVFATQLQKMVQDNKAAKEIASFAHREITRIQPFMVGNGRIARIIMNVIRMLFGYIPVTCEGDAKYMKAVRAGDEKPEIFEKYINRQEQLMHQKYGKQVRCLGDARKTYRDVANFFLMVSGNTRVFGGKNDHEESSKAQDDDDDGMSTFNAWIKKAEQKRRKKKKKETKKRKKRSRPKQTNARPKIKGPEIEEMD